MNAPLQISTAQASGAFHYAGQEDYGVGNGPARVAQGPGPRPAGPYGPYPAPVYGAPYPYPYPYSPYYYGPRVGVVIGPGFYYRGGFRR
jgi:hypothetical protein